MLHTWVQPSLFPACLETCTVNNLTSQRFIYSLIPGLRDNIRDFQMWCPTFRPHSVNTSQQEMWWWLDWVKVALVVVSTHLSQCQAESRPGSLSDVSQSIHQPFKCVFQLICLQFTERGTTKWCRDMAAYSKTSFHRMIQSCGYVLDSDWLEGVKFWYRSHHCVCIE